MKVFLKIMAGVAILSLMGVIAYAADSGDVWVKTTVQGADVHRYYLDWQASATATKSSITIEDVRGYVILGVTGVAGGTDCADDYDITLKDSDGVDVFGGELADRLGAGGEQAYPKAGNAYGARFVDGTLTAAFTELATANCDGEFIFYTLDAQ